MPNIHYLPIEDQPEREKWSFDMTQLDSRGFVLIDACVPFELAIEFMNLLSLYGRLCPSVASFWGG